MTTTQTISALMEKDVDDENDERQKRICCIKVSPKPYITPSPSPSPATSSVSKWRNIAGFWLLGLLSHYPYVIMLSAAFDIIHSVEGEGASGEHNSTQENMSSCALVWNETTNVSSYSPRELCQRQGTSVILLADILPTFIIKLIAPYFMNFIPYWIRVLFITGFSLLSFVLVAVSTREALVILGVACASISSGFGEIVFLSLTARYHKSTLAAWASGTGGAGVAAALAYALLKTFLSPIVALLVQLFVPLMILLVYFILLGPANSNPNPNNPGLTEEGASPHDNNSVEINRYNVEEQDGDKKKKGEMEMSRISPPETCGSDKSPLLAGEQRMNKRKDGRQHSLKELKEHDKVEAKLWFSHVKYIPHLFKYMIPLFLVYFAEYAINQGFFELLYNTNTHIGAYCMDQKTQYRWLQVIYQVGELVSRSSVSVIYIRHFWILALLQLLNFVFFFTAVIYLFLPSFWLTFFLIFYEGLLGGAVYVNAFYAITKEVPSLHREFSMGVASSANSTGICAAGLCSFFIHNYICGHLIGFLNS